MNDLIVWMITLVLIVVAIDGIGGIEARAMEEEHLRLQEFTQDKTKNRK